MSMIYDGTGSNYRAKVSSDNRLKVDAITEQSFVHAAEEGLAFNINTEAMAISGVAPYEKGLLYVKNNESVDMEVIGWFVGEKNDRSGGNTTEPLLFSMYGNPTGTIGGNVLDVANRRVGAARQFDITAYSEPTGWAVTGSPLLYQYQYSDRSFGEVNFIVPPGQSIIVTVTSEADSFTCYTGFTGYLGDD